MAVSTILGTPPYCSGFPQPPVNLLAGFQSYAIVNHRVVN